MPIIIIAEFILDIFVVLMVFNLFYDFINLIKGYGPNLPSTNLAVNAITQIYEFKSGEKVADFGSGTGKIINKLKKLPVNIVGVELNPVLCFVSKIRFLLNKNVSIKNKDFFQEDLSNYDVIIIYGIGPVIKKLQDKIIQTNIKKLVVISNIFQFPDIKYSKKIGSVYLYYISSAN